MRNATGIDVGRSSATAVRGRVQGSGFQLTGFAHGRNPDGTLAGGWAALAPSFSLGASRVGLSGREVNVRYTRVPRVPDWKLRKLMRFEAEEVASHSDTPVASDFNVLPELAEVDGEDVVLLSMAREGLLAEHAEGLAGLGGKLDAATPNAIGLYNAFVRYGVVLDDTVLVANIGAENTDVVLVRGADLVFARNLSGGSRLFDEALAARFDVALERAETYKVERASLKADAARDANREKAAKAMLAPAGQILSLLESTVLFCKSQLKLSSLKIDRVLLCGGGARLEGLCEYLAEGLRVPVELFDPFVVVDASALGEEEAALLEAHRLEAVVALGLATAASDPEAYSIEILPEEVRRRRDFVGGTLFLVAAAVLALAYLGLYAWRSSARLGELEDRGALLERRLESARSIDVEARGLVDENELLAALAEELFELGGTGEQLLRTLDALERELPREFWLEELACLRGSDEELGIVPGEERPIVRVRGRAREGTGARTAAFEEFVGGLRGRLPDFSVKERMSDTASRFTLDLTMFGARDAGSAADPGEERADGSGEAGR